MKHLCGLILLLAFALPGRAMVYGDSEVLSVAEMEKLGVHVTVDSLPGPKNALRWRISVFVLPSDKEHRFNWLSYSVLEKELGSDFARPENAGRRDAATWAKQTRGEAVKKPIIAFAVSDTEMPKSYIKVEFILPPRGGIGSFGSYYLPLSELGRAANQSSQPTPPKGD